MSSATLTERGLELSILGWHVWTIDRADLIDAHVVSAFSRAELFRNPFETMRFGYGFGFRYVLVEKLGWPRYLAITPDDPEAFVASFGETVEISLATGNDA